VGMATVLKMGAKAVHVRQDTDGVSRLTADEHSRISSRVPARE